MRTLSAIMSNVAYLTSQIVKIFMSHVLPFDERNAEMSMTEMRPTYGTLMFAGSENVATDICLHGSSSA